MPPMIVGREGPLSGSRFPIGGTPMTFGRGYECDVTIASGRASRSHAEIRRAGDRYVLHDLGSRNGTRVNGEHVTAYELRPGDLITIGDESFRFEASDDAETIADATRAIRKPATSSPGVLRATITGGGPVGLSLALLLDHLMGDRVAVTVYDGRWMRDGDRIVWKGQEQGNVRRQQVVTIQSRQYLSLPEPVLERLFSPGSYAAMWPAGPDSVRGQGPRDLRIAHLEDRLLELANEKAGRIRLVPAAFSPSAHREAMTGDHVLAVCEGGRSRTREHYAQKFGNPDTFIFSLDGQHLKDVVLGLRVRSGLPDPTAVLLTVAQNRFLLNALRGEGFLHMRLTEAEAAELACIDPARRTFEPCGATSACVMTRTEHGEFRCSTHAALFLPALVRSSPLWGRVLEGLRLFGIAEEDLSAVTAFQLGMVQRPRFTARLHPRTATTPGTYGFLLGDAANAIHFWPGRGLNSGIASAVSLARSLSRSWRGEPFRDADFARHEAAMSMLQYRHKSRAWNAMVTTDEHGVTRAIKDEIARSIENGGEDSRQADLDALMDRLRQLRGRLDARLPGLPDDATLAAHLRALKSETLRTLVASGAWDTPIMGGEEVDLDLFYREDAPTLHREDAATPDTVLLAEADRPTKVIRRVPEPS